MDLENLNCPQYVRFSSESFQDSLNNYDTSSSGDLSISLNHGSPIEGDVERSPSSSYQDALSVVSTEEEFVVHTRTTRSQASKVKKEVTIPKPFHFQTDNRLKSKDVATSANEEKDFASQLRHHEAPRSTTCGVTKVKAFHLTENKVKKGEGTYVSLAQKIQAFQKTPDRYHSTANKEFQPQEHWSPPKLRPRTPKLQAVKRHRAVYALSREEQEAKELEEMKAYEFHARPVDPRVFKPIVTEKRETKQTTLPKGIELKTSQRATVERSVPEESHASYEFHARPVPKNILLGPTGLGEKPEVKTTKPVSPAFCTRQRLEKRKIAEEQHEEVVAKKGKMEQKKPKKKNRKTQKRQPKPKFVRPVPTEIKPFSFDQADKQRFHLKEKKIQEEIEKENKPFVFKAQPLPSPSVSTLPKVEKKPITQPEPFNFILDTRSFNHSQASVKEESVSFKAQPATVLKKEPFIPEKPPKFSIEFKEFDLNTDRRASERLKLQELKEAEEREKEQMRLARKALEEEKERQEILKLRQELVHKAKPVQHFKTVEIKPSSKKLTEPISPQFETNKRLKVRNHD